MNKQEFEAWSKITAQSYNRWQVDAIHNGENGQDLLVYKGGADGTYARIDQTGLVELGKYAGAVPHIGEAMFTPSGKVQCENFSNACARFFSAIGAEALRKMFG